MRPQPVISSSSFAGLDRRRDPGRTQSSRAQTSKVRPFGYAAMRGSIPDMEKDSLATIALPGRTHKADELYEYLRGAILDGTLPPDERLVEQRVAKIASVSRTPVREALHRLEMDGLVSSDAGGLVVVDHSLEEMAELCTVREELESFAARLGAASRSQVDVSTLERILDETAVVAKEHDVARLIELNHLFHETIWQSARNRYLARELGVLRGLIERRGRSTLTDERRQGEAVDEHMAIFEAIAARDSEAAAEATRTHFQRAMALRLLQIRERESAR
jgi:DNA-binding GntR family transcriptional regulator